jgi:hypothetical protein
MNYDLSTINHDYLKETFKKVELKPGYHLQEDPGNGCFLDPPGYPSYFTRSIYTPSGNEPRSGATMELLGYAVEYADSQYDPQRAWVKPICLWMKSAYLPLHIDHPRVKAWINHCYSHQRNCYIDENQIAEPFEYGRPKMLIYPVPYYKLESFYDDERFSDEWRTKEKARIEQKNKEIEELYRKVCIPENHSAYRQIKEFYPEHKPNLELIKYPPKYGPGDWYERHENQPTPETCTPPQWLGHHRKTGWCQFCGHVGSEEQ